MCYKLQVFRQDSIAGYFISHTPAGPVYRRGAGRRRTEGGASARKPGFIGFSAEVPSDSGVEETTKRRCDVAVITMKELLEAGVHFGHQAKRWNPRMKKYIFGERNGIYIIDLQKTLRKFKEAYNFVSDTAADGRPVLFVGTKKQAQDSVAEEAGRCGQYYVNQRWLGGMLTNFETLRKGIEKLRKLERMKADGTYEKISKKEVASLEKKRQQLLKNLGGIKDMPALPGAVFVVDPRKEAIAVMEARRLGIPVVGIVDTNCDPDVIDYVIPGNDDAIRAIKLIATKIADAVMEGQQRRRDKVEGRVTASMAASEEATGEKPAEIPAAQESDTAAEPGDTGSFA